MIRAFAIATASVLLSMVLMLIGGVDDAAAQCYRCVNDTGPNGPTCNATLPGPYKTCGCPCACSGACPDTTGGGGEEPERPVGLEELAAFGAALPPTGVLLASPPDAGSLKHLHAGSILGRPAENVCFTSSLGLVRYTDGTWRAFPLETADWFVIRDCGGGSAGSQAHLA